VVDALRSNLLFRDLSPRELQYLATLVYERTYEKGETVFRQNDRGFGMYVISRGKVEIRNAGRHGESALTTLEAGSFFGELSLIERENIRTASAIAVERTTLVGFFKPDLMAILESKPTTGVKILFQLSTVVGQRLLETTQRLKALEDQNGDSDVVPPAASAA